MKAAVSEMMAFRDDQGDPMMLVADGLVIVVPPSIFFTAQEAIEGHTEAIERLVHAISAYQKPGLGGPGETLYTSPTGGPSLMDETAMAKVLGISNRTLGKYRRQDRLPNCWIRNAGRIMWKVSEPQESWTRGIA